MLGLLDENTDFKYGSGEAKLICLKEENGQ